MNVFQLSINIVNPRLPNRRIYQTTVANIRECGIKKPITILRRNEPDEDGKQFDLICSYGRLEALLALGEKTIPAVIIETSCGEKAQRAHKGSRREGTTH